MTDRDVVQAFLVADEVLRRRQPPLSGPCLSIDIATDARMPRNMIAVGYATGAIIVHVVTAP